MPYITDTKALNDPFLKRSAKLLPCQKEMIVWWGDRGSLKQKMKNTTTIKAAMLTAGDKILPEEYPEDIYIIVKMGNKNGVPYFLAKKEKDSNGADDIYQEYTGRTVVEKMQ